MINTGDCPFEWGKLSTPSGQIEFKSEKAALCGLLNIPDYKPIKEHILSHGGVNGVSSRPEADFPLIPLIPLILVTPPNHYFLNSSFAGVSSLKVKAREPFLEINPKDAKDREISDGDLVMVENERGCVSIKAKVLDSVLPGVVVSAGLWWKDDYINGSGVNALTPDDLSDIGGGATFFSTSVEVKKI
jgi:anaerobic selenocysteine-containing dehydrogenase